MPIQFDSVAILRGNSTSTFLDVSNLLVRFAENILKDPSNPKYRKIRVANKIVQSRLLPVDGAIQCLFEMGFEEDGDFFTFPEHGNLQGLRLLKDELNQARHVQNDQPATQQEQPTRAAPQTSPIIASRPTSSLPQPSIGSEAAFFKLLQVHSQNVKLYEDRALQQAALRCIPVDQLQGAASKAKQQSPSLDLRDLLLLELLAWFKRDFFTWVNSPDCDFCGNSTSSIGMADPTQAELMYGASRVENYKCSSCNRETRFPRYNHPGKLLETRRGRCGEWANCFTLCCRAMDFEARYILDKTDHVWTEVFSISQQRWLHCDPCDNVCDKPLVYEAGWKKKLSYIIAFSKDEVVDVSWRYSNKHTELKSRRYECREDWLVTTLFNMRKSMQKDMSSARKEDLQQRMVKELCEFMSERAVGEGETQGRVSGSLAWRRARGEISPVVKKTVITPTDEELKQGFIQLKYNSALNSYQRSGQQIHGWQSLVEEASNIMRKEEMDWKMVYLARTEGSDSAKISWRVQLDGTGYSLASVEINSLATATYENGKVSWRICAGDSCTLINPDKMPHLIEDLKGEKGFNLTAELTRGRGDVAWQHTQLFRQSLIDHNALPFSIKINLSKEH